MENFGYIVVGFLACFIAFKVTLRVILTWYGFWMYIATHSKEYDPKQLKNFGIGCLILTLFTCLIPLYGTIGESIVNIVRSW